MLFSIIYVILYVVTLLLYTIIKPVSDKQWFSSFLNPLQTSSQLKSPDTYPKFWVHKTRKVTPL